MEASASEPECSGDEQSRPIYGQQDPMVPVLGVVGGTPGWAVREIISISLRVCCDLFGMMFHHFQKYSRYKIIGEKSGLKLNLKIHSYSPQN
jgi:hypothetical protein